MASFSFQNLLQRPHCREQQPDGRPAATPLAAEADDAHATPPGSLRPGQWTSYEWHDLLGPGSRHSHRAWKTGKTLLEGEEGRGCWRLWGDGFCTPSSLPLSLESPSRSAANWLGDMAGCRFPVGLCGTLAW